MQSCEEALTEYIQENLLIVATIAITFVVAEVHIYAYVCETRLCSHIWTILWQTNSVPNADLCIII